VRDEMPVLSLEL